ncbi:MAG: hypothetical protein AAF702_32005 [Chloroflexota bacterium]
MSWERRLSQQAAGNLYDLRKEGGNAAKVNEGIKELAVHEAPSQFAEPVENELLEFPTFKTNIDGCYVEFELWEKDGRKVINITLIKQLS